ncbi:MAG: DUF3991 domain-containing protein [Oscillospiraceae bacterium]|nr:DUF3991 domain-containing protein [Oscillospiraceae bacterium]
MPRYTKEEYQAAIQVDFLKFVQSRHHLEHAGRTWHLKERDSFVIFPGQGAYWYSRELRIRDPVDFLIKYEGMSAPEAVRTICDDYLRGKLERPAKFMPRKSKPKRQQTEFVLPEKSSRSEEVFDYLTGKRALDPEIVGECLDNGSVYQTARTISKPDGTIQFFNAVFVGFDEQGVPRSAFQRGMQENYQFRGDIANSDKAFGFTYGPSNAETLCIFEAAIDALSFATLEKAEGRNDCALLAMGGLNPAPIEKFLEQHENVKKIRFCTDADEAGMKFAETQGQLLADRGYEVSITLPSQGKDFNEALCIQKHDAALYHPVPRPAKDDSRMMEHLTEKRLISENLSIFLKNRGLLFQAEPSGLTDQEGFRSSTMVFRDDGYLMELPIILTQNSADLILEYGAENSASAFKIKGINEGVHQLLVFDNPVSMIAYLDHALQCQAPTANAHYLCRYSNPERAVQAYLEEHPEIQTVSLIFERDGSVVKHRDGTLEAIDYRENKIHAAQEILRDYPVEVMAKLRGHDPSFQQLFRDIRRAEKQEIVLQSCQKR